MRTKIKNVVSGKVVDRTFNAGAKIDIENVDRRDFSTCTTTATTSSSWTRPTTTRSPSRPPSSATPPTTCSRTRRSRSPLHNGNPLYVELPASVVLEVTYTEPGLQGDRSSAGTKPATARDGRRDPGAAVPRAGHQVKVDTRDGDYLGRVTTRQ